MVRDTTIKPEIPEAPEVPEVPKVQTVERLIDLSLINDKLNYIISLLETAKD